MTRIEQIQDCIDRATLRQSNMTELAWAVPALESLQIRHLLNNVGSISERYLCVGTHRGGSFVSALCTNGNLKSATGVDSFASDEAYNSEKVEPEFYENVKLILPPSTEFKFVKGNAFGIDINQILGPIDLFEYDAGHSRTEQKNALIYYKPILADEFIYCCDDFNWGEVKAGTFEGIQEGGYEIIKDWELSNPPELDSEDHSNEHWWRGYYIALLRKK